jgi:hypothetical protein
MPNDDKPTENQETKNEAITGFAALSSLNNSLNFSTNILSNDTLNTNLSVPLEENITSTKNETSKNITSENETKIERSINKTKESTSNKGLQTGLFGLTTSNYVLTLILLASIILGVSSMILLRVFKYKQKEMPKRAKSSKN